MRRGGGRTLTDLFLMALAIGLSEAEDWRVDNVSCFPPVKSKPSLSRERDNEERERCFCEETPSSCRFWLAIRWGWLMSMVYKPPHTNLGYESLG